MPDNLPYLIGLLLSLPILGALGANFLKGRRGDLVAVIFATFTLLLGLGIIGQSFPGRHLFPLGKLPWIELPGFKVSNFLGFFIDPISALMLFVIVLVGFLVILYSTDYMGPGNKEHPVTNGKGKYYFWMFFFICSMIGVATAPNFFQLFIFWEMTTLCSWALISYYGHDEALTSGYKALIMTHLGGLFLMVALVVLFIKTGSFDFIALNKVGPGLCNTLFTLILVAAWAKAAQVPFYTWLPDAMEAPTPVSCYLHAAAMVKAGVYLAARVVCETYHLSYGAGLLTSIVAIVTMAVGVFLYFFQDDLKRILAFSTITHLAWVLLGCSLGIFGSLIGFQGALLHIAAHACGKGLLFLSVGAIAYATGSKRISELSGLMSKLPLVAFAFFIGMLTITGVPPFAGFWSKFLILTGALESGGWGVTLAILALIESMVAFAFFLWVVGKVFFGEPSKAALQAADPTTAINIVLLLFSILCLVVTVFVWPLVQNVSLGVVR